MNKVTVKALHRVGVDNQNHRPGDMFEVPENVAEELIVAKAVTLAEEQNTTPQKAGGGGEEGATEASSAIPAAPESATASEPEGLTDDEKIRQALQGMTPGDLEQFTASGLPRVEVVEVRSDIPNLTRALVDPIWETLQAGKG